MRRNTVTVLKYLVFAAVFLTLGPVTLRMLFGDSKSNQPRDVHAGGIGLPEDPDVRRKHVELENLQNEEDVKVIDMNQIKQGDDINRNIDQGVPQPHQAYGTGKKIDWHDYKQIAEEKARTGPGEQGAAVILTAEEEAKKDTLYKVNGFNAFASDKISLDRSLKDIRHPDCKKKQYLDRLPNASVVVPFHNEHWSTLLRTAVSVLNRSPSHLIHEVILVDDFSSKEHTKKQLDDHLATHYGGKVKVIHQDRREGLIRTRITGAKAATGEVIIFLDSHCEANVNWLPPLLEPIAEDYRTVVCPFIDVIDFETFAYRAQDEGARGAFDWEFFYKRLPLLPEDLKHPADPFKSPVMAGGLFAISAKWFWELGGYDPGLDIWGGEQYELSFKLWQCGGVMVDAPCSRVGHVYRKFNPFGAPGRGDYTGKLWQCGGMMVDAPCSRVGHIYRKFAPFPNPGVGDFVGRNYRRVAEVWMDEYAEYLYLRRPHYRSIDPGDISEQLAIRKKLQCKPFKWFMTEVAFDLPKKYPPIEPPNVAEGELRNVGTNMCVDTRFRGQNERFQIEPCIKDHAGAGGEQNLELTWHKDMRPRKRNFCFDVSQSIAKAPVILYNCHGMRGNQWFKYNVDTKQLYHPVSAQCLDCDGGSKEIFMSRCDTSANTQQWHFEKVNTTLARQEWDFRE